MANSAAHPDRWFHVTLIAVCGTSVLLVVAFAWLLVATEPRRRAEYLANCQARGFTAEQCTFLYTERQRQDADAAAALAVGAAALAVGATRR